MTVRAKFWTDIRAEQQWGTKVTLRAVTRGEDNKVWSAATPVGLIELTIKNEAAAAHFKPGTEFFVTAPKPDAPQTPPPPKPPPNGSSHPPSAAVSDLDDLPPAPPLSERQLRSRARVEALLGCKL